MAINIVLYEPEIPANTGNIARSCAATGAILHLIKPLGFSLEDKMLKRAGLDYWDEVEVKVYDTIKELYEIYPESRFFYATTKTKQRYSDVFYQDEDFIVFGRETAGLPLRLLEANWSQAIKLPMRNTSRSLNLSNAVAIVLYEALRQLDFTPITD